MAARKLGRGEFAKYHGLGNDYLVIDPARFGARLTPARVRALCHRNLGPGSDGIMALAPARRGDFGARVYNPDGSEAEKSGNGLRIFARFLHDFGYTRRTELAIETKGGVVGATLRLRRGRVHRVSLDMGRVSFQSDAIPVAGPPREVVDELLRADAFELRVTCLSIGNPHCVVFMSDPTRDDLLRLGPAIENHPSFPERINVQLARVESRSRVRALIWERGAGETLASGTSSCAVAAAALRKGLVDPTVTVAMQGGDLDLEIDADFGVRLTGPCTPVYRGRLLD